MGGKNFFDHFSKANWIWNEPRLNAATSRWRWFPLLSLYLNFTYFEPLWLLAGIKGKNWLKKKRTGGKMDLMYGCRSPVTASLGHMVFPEVVLVRSRHAIHRGVRETRRLRRHTHLPSTNPLLYGGRPILNFAQQPSSVVGDVVLWCSTTLWHTSWLFQLVAII